MVMATPFEGLTKSQIHKLLDLLGVHVYKFNKNQEILPTIKNEHIDGIIKMCIRDRLNRLAK